MTAQITYPSQDWLDAIYLCDNIHGYGRNYPCLECRKSVEMAVREKINKELEEVCNDQQV